MWSGRGERPATLAIAKAVAVRAVASIQSVGDAALQDAYQMAVAILCAPELHPSFAPRYPNWLEHSADSATNQRGRYIAVRASAPDDSYLRLGLHSNFRAP